MNARLQSTRIWALALPSIASLMVAPRLEESS
jgi:hypothetical protein